ncbi:hypothetical protein HAT91_04589 [Dickeya solani]|nr:hypothetical protein HAT91_04589 [Dickeya solani]
MAAGHRGMLFSLMKHPDPGVKIVPVFRITPVIMGNHAGNLAGIAADTILRICDNKLIHILSRHVQHGCAYDPPVIFRRAFIKLSKCVLT